MWAHSWGTHVKRTLLSVGAVSLLACTPPPPKLPPRLPSSAALKKNTSSHLGIGDVVEVRVYQEPELTGLYRIEAYGGFTFPLIGQIQATGLTPSELSQLLADRLKSGFLRNPQVTVFVKESHSKKIFILGKVKKPGTYPFEEGMSVVQAVAVAGGLLPIAARDLILIRSSEEDDTDQEGALPCPL